MATQIEKDAAIAAAQASLDAANALVVETSTTITEIDVKESDGTDEKFVPETPAA